MTNQTIVVGIDQSDQSAAALRWAADYAHLTGARLRAIYVQFEPVMALPYAAAVSGIPLSNPVAPDTGAWDGVQDLFASIHPDPSWTLTQIRHGSIGAELVAAARDASLLVVGKGEHRGLDRLIEGSVSVYCLRHAEVPVVGVPVVPVETDEHRPRVAARSAT